MSLPIKIMNPVVYALERVAGFLRQVGINSGHGCLPVHSRIIAGLFLCVCLSSAVKVSAADASLEPAFSHIFSKHSSVMLLIDPSSGNIVDANPSAARFYGFSQRELTQMSIQQINTLTAEQVKQERQLADSEGRNYFIFRHRLATDEVRTVTVNSHPFEFSNRKLLLSVIHDITPGRHDAQAMWHYQARLEEMVEQQVDEIEKVRQQKLMLMWGGIVVQAIVIAWLVISIQRGRRLQRAVSSQRQGLANIIWGTDAGTWEWNIETGEAKLNARWAETLGYSLDELQPISIDTWWKFAHPDDIERSRRALQYHFMRQTDAYQCQVRMKHKLGHWVWVQDRGKVVEWSEDGKPIWITGTQQEITEQKQAEESLLQAASVFEHANEGIMITDPEGTIQNANLAFSNITGYERDEVIGENPRIFSSGYHDAAYFEDMWDCLNKKGSWTSEIWNRRKGGEVFAAIQTVSAIKDANGNVLRYVSLFSDITALKEQQKQLEQIAHYDALTGLPNRVLLSDRLKLALAQAKRNDTLLAVAFFDLDGFKSVNDTYGHSVGDRLLVKLAERSQKALREGDSLARLGGDEFVAVLQGLHEVSDSAPILERLLTAISKPVHINELKVQVSASLGVTFFPQNEEIDADQLIRQADQAMYVAKQSGKNRYHLFDAEHDRTVRGHHDKLLRLRQAFERNEFALFYQPKVNMRTGRVVGAEALIRWLHPEEGTLPPIEFLPVMASSNAMVIEVGDWVIETALKQIVAWRNAGLEMPVSVNIDAVHLQLPDFVERLKALLEKYPEVRAGDLELEVLETSALNEIARVSEIILSCRDIGVNFALDDFGTGYSSLTYLKQLPAHLLKIDRSFVCDMLEDLEDLSILEGVIGLANAFRCQTIAEGVESVAQGEMLLMMGCEQAQGYVIAKPMPAEEIPVWKAQWQLPESWQGRSVINRDDLPFLFAMVEHRSWYRELMTYLTDLSTELPEDKYLYCQFNHWLEKIDLSRYSDHADMQQLLRLHEDVHLHANELLSLKTEGLTLPEAKVQLFDHGFNELQAMLLARLQ